MHLCEQWRLHCNSIVSGRRKHYWVAMYCVAITFKMTGRIEQWICIKFCVKFEHSSLETIWVIQKGAATGNCWLAASSWQHACSCITSQAEIFGETSNYPRDSAPLQPKTKITFEREEIPDPQWDSGKYDAAADSNWENCVRSQGPTLKGTEASLSLYHVSCILSLL